MLNRIVLIGRLTSDPKLRYTKSNIAVASFTLAVDRRYKNAGGERFGRLIVLKAIIADPNDTHCPKEYLCRCDCGTEKAILRSSLLDGKTKSCGCLRRENRGFYKTETSLCNTCVAPLCEWLLRKQIVNGMEVHERAYSRIDKGHEVAVPLYIVTRCASYLRG